jgi:hypothetical protein
MALTFGWTLREVYDHSPRELRAMGKAIEDRERAKRMARARRRR